MSSSSEHTPQQIQVHQEPIELCKLLKIANMVSGGGEAKIVITEGYVLLNGDVEYQKRKKIYHHDLVEFNGEIIQVVVNEALPLKSSIITPQFKVKVNEKNQSKKKPQPDCLSIEGESTIKKRKPISF